MNEQVPSEARILPSLEVALIDCCDFSRHMPYIWKPASMKKLEALGLVERETLMHSGRVAYKVTEKGREYLANRPWQSK